MKKILNAILTIIVTFMIPFCMVPVHAEEDARSSSIYSVDIPLDQDYYEDTFYDANGNLTTLVVKDLPAVTRVSNGAKLVSYSSANINMSYTIVVASNKITKAYDPSYSFSSGTVKSHSLLFSDTKATLTVTISGIIGNISHSLISKIQNKQLTIIFI